MAVYDDPRILRAVAHPTRNRILAELFAGGSLRAADIARTLDIPANQASFHLRQLAKYGLVEEAPEEGRDRRDRVWRLTSDDGITFRTQDIVKQPGGEAAYDVFRRSAVAWHHHLVDQAYVRDPESDTKKTISDYALRLTPEESQELSTEITELIDRWRHRTREGGEERTTYSIFQLIQPMPDQLEGVRGSFRVRGFGSS